MLHRSAMVSVLALGALSTGASGEILFGLEYNGATPLFEVNQGTGAVTPIGPTGRDSLGDLTSDTRPGSFRVWANSIAANQLIRLDPVTGAEMSSVDLDTEAPITSLAFDAVTGKLYGNTSITYGAPFEALYEIDPDTGTTAFVGRILFDDVFALAFDNAGTLFGVSNVSNSLISISTVSGNGAFIAGMQLSQVFDIAARPSDGTMFLTDSGSDRLWTLDTSNGDVFDVGLETGLLQGNLVGLAFGPIPAPGTGAAVALVGIAGLRRRRARG